MIISLSEVTITDGLFFVKKNAEQIKTGDDICPMTLMLKRPDIEIMRQIITTGTLVWISPADDRSMVEFFYILSGRVTFESEPGKLTELKSGDSFYVASLTHDIAMTPVETTELLYITNRPVFDGIQDFHNNLFALLNQINAKDNITLLHSRNVRKYAFSLYEELKPDGLTLDELTNAAVFHDVGKCQIPDEILKKQGRLTRDEYETMKRHASASYDVLAPLYGDKIASIAGGHHERLDGSGYPSGLKADEIPYGAKLIAVADAFDAMTSPRTYNKIKTDAQAHAELASLPEQYDATIVKTLGRLLKENRLRKQSEADNFESMYASYLSLSE